MPDASPAARGPMQCRRESGRPRLTVLLLLATLSGFPLPASGGEPPLALLLTPGHVVQGGVVVVRVDSPMPMRAIRLQVGDREVRLVTSNSPAQAEVLIGIDLEQAPGPVLVRAEAEAENGRRFTGQGTLRVLDAHFPVRRLTVPRGFVELDADTLERIAREKAILDRLWETATPDRLWRGPFRPPLDGGGSGVGFGERRIINGEPRSPHTGADFASPSGTPVLAPETGIVALVADHFFAGTSIILDHGLGLYTMYFHLQESLVRSGERVGQGQVLARIGSTGRATGPHLHWGARLHGARIDPAALLRIPSLD